MPPSRPGQAVPTSPCLTPNTYPLVRWLDAECPSARGFRSVHVDCRGRFVNLSLAGVTVEISIALAATGGDRAFRVCDDRPTGGSADRLIERRYGRSGITGIGDVVTDGTVGTGAGFVTVGGTVAGTVTGRSIGAVVGGCGPAQVIRRAARCVDPRQIGAGQGRHGIAGRDDDPITGKWNRPVIGPSPLVWACPPPSASPGELAMHSRN